MTSLPVQVSHAVVASYYPLKSYSSEEHDLHETQAKKESTCKAYSLLTAAGVAQITQLYGLEPYQQAALAISSGALVYLGGQQSWRDKVKEYFSRKTS